jgi:hypothetical protein
MTWHPNAAHFHLCERLQLPYDTGQHTLFWELAVAFPDVVPAILRTNTLRTKEQRRLALAAVAAAVLPPAEDAA